jgi:hypothetical protein
VDPTVTFVKLIPSVLTCHWAVGAGKPNVEDAVKETLLFPAVLQPVTSEGFNETVGGLYTVIVTFLFLVQPVAVIVSVKV